MAGAIQQNMAGIIINLVDARFERFDLAERSKAAQGTRHFYDDFGGMHEHPGTQTEINVLDLFPAQLVALRAFFHGLGNAV